MSRPASRRAQSYFTARQLPMSAPYSRGASALTDTITDSFSCCDSPLVEVDQAPCVLDRLLEQTHRRGEERGQYGHHYPSTDKNESVLGHDRRSSITVDAIPTLLPDQVQLASAEQMCTPTSSFSRAFFSPSTSSSSSSSSPSFSVVHSSCSSFYLPDTLPQSWCLDSVFQFNSSSTAGDTLPGQSACGMHGTHSIGVEPSDQPGCEVEPVEPVDQPGIAFNTRVGGGSDITHAMSRCGSVVGEEAGLVLKSSWAGSRKCCHQCKSARMFRSLLSCTRSARIPGHSRRRCSKAYCDRCLARHYGLALAKMTNVAKQAWTCPACLSTCNCCECERQRTAQSGARGAYHTSTLSSFPRRSVHPYGASRYSSSSSDPLSDTAPAGCQIPPSTLVGSVYHGQTQTRTRQQTEHLASSPLYEMLNSPYTPKPVRSDLESDEAADEFAFDMNGYGPDDDKSDWSSLSAPMSSHNSSNPNNALQHNHKRAARTDSERCQDSCSSACTWEQQSSRYAQQLQDLRRQLNQMSREIDQHRLCHHRYHQSTGAEGVSQHP